MDKKELLMALEDRAEELRDMLRNIGSDENREFERVQLELLNKMGEEKRTMDEYLHEEKMRVKARLSENAVTFEFVKSGNWNDTR